jgi:hypothetical protein
LDILGAAVDEKVSGTLVVDDPAGFGIIGRGIPHTVARYVRIKGEKEPNLPPICPKVLHDDLPNEDVLVEVHRVIAHDEDPQSLMVEAHFRHKGLFLIFELPFPAIPNPGEFAVNPDPQSAVIASYVVFLTDVREVEVPYCVVFVETDKQLAIAHRDVSRHC